MIYFGAVDELPGQNGCISLASVIIDRLRAWAPEGQLAPAAWQDLEREAARLIIQATLAQCCLGGRAGLRREAWWTFPDPQAFLECEQPYSLCPDLARLTRALVLDWELAIKKMICRLRQDRSHIKSFFGVDSGDLVLRIGCPGAEYHNADFVRSLHFHGGTLAYKPRSVGRETWWGLLAHNLMRAQIAELYAPDTLAKHGYGWSRWIEPGDPDEIPRFYERSGQLLFWIWLTHTRDAVASNIRTWGDRPCLIDCETVLYPVAPGTTHTLAATGMLPSASGGSRRERAGLSDLHSGCHDVRVAIGDSNGTIRFARQRLRNTEQLNVPSQDSGAAACDHAREIASGFRSSFEMALELGESLIKYLPQRLPHLTVGRFVPRPTIIYGELLAGYLATSCSKGWLEQELRALPLPASFPQHWGPALVEAELSELARLSVPRFTFTETATGLKLRSPELRLEGWCDGLTSAHRRIATLSKIDREQLQAEILDAFHQADSAE